MSSATEAFSVRALKTADVPGAVALQITYLGGSVVTELGERFLSRFHDTALEDPTAIACIAVSPDGATVGFALATLDVRAFTRRVRPRICSAVATSLLAPSRWPLMWNIARGLFEPEPHPQIEAALLLLVVDASARRRGIGRQLLQHVEARFVNAGLGRYRVGVRSDLLEARTFYRALAFEVEQELVTLGRPMTYLVKELSPKTA